MLTFASMSSGEQPTSSPRLTTDAEALVVGRYVLAAQLARGGLATVYLGRLLGEGGLRRTVAIKRLQAQFRTDGDLSTMFLDEARLALRVRHPNVVHAVDVIMQEDELFLVMEYVEGVSLGRLMAATSGSEAKRIPRAIVSSVICGVLHGLHAAHETKDERGKPLNIVHRDVSPSNVIVGTDGIARVLDFGVAKAAGQAHITRDGVIKGKLAYMAPECVTGQELTRRADVFSTGIMLWEMLTGRRLFYGSSEASLVNRIIQMEIPAPSTIDATIPPEVDAVVLRALERDDVRRFATAEEMAIALEKVLAPASMRQVRGWVQEVGSEQLERSAALLASVEGASATPAAMSLELAASEAKTKSVGYAKERARRPPPRAAVLAGCALVVAAVVAHATYRASSDRAEVTSVTSRPVVAAIAAAPATVAIEPPPSASSKRTPADPAASVSAALEAPLSSAIPSGSASGNKPRVPPGRREGPAASPRIYTRD